MLYDRVLYDARKEMGMHLAEEAPVDADIVIPVPDSGVPAAIGYAERSGIPFGEGLIKNRYIGRTFIQPTPVHPAARRQAEAEPAELRSIAGKRLVVVDDSIVRGTTSQKIVEILKEAGAAEVHMRISSPPISCPCFYGIDTADRGRAHRFAHERRGYQGVPGCGFAPLPEHGEPGQSRAGLPRTGSAPPASTGTTRWRSPTT